MTANCVKHISEKDGNLLNDLQTLLESQIKLAHKGDIAGVESLISRANSVIEQIVKSEIFKQTDCENQREKLQRLYKQLSVAISAQRTETGEQINRIRRGKKTIGTYRDNI